MKPARVYLGTWVVAIGLLGCAAQEPDPPVEPRPDGDRDAPLRSLPQVTELPSDYRPIGELADRGMFYTAGDRPAFRIDDGGDYHGYAGPGVWAQDPKGTRTQGLLYGIEDGAIVSAGYLVRQADLATGKSFHGLTLRELDFPTAHAMTVDLIEGETAEANQSVALALHPTGGYGPDNADGWPTPVESELAERIHGGRVRPYTRDALLSGHGASLHRNAGHRPDVQSSTDCHRRRHGDLRRGGREAHLCRIRL